MFFQRKKFLIVISVLTTAWLLVLIGWLLFYKRIEARSTEIADNVKNRVQLEERIQQARLLERTVTDIADLDSKLNRYFLKEDDAVDFLDRIERIASVAGVEIEPTSLSKSENGELDFAISAKGNFSNLLHLSALIESIPYNIEANKISLTLNPVVDSKSKQNGWKMDISLTVRSFLAKEETK